MTLDVLPPILPGVGLGANLGPARRLCDSMFSEGRVPAGVAFCALRKGDSGRGNDGRVFGRKAGLAARPGPTDWLNLCGDGVGGVYIS